MLETPEIVPEEIIPENTFGICIDDGSVCLPEFVVEQNTSSVSLYDWQRKAIDFFFFCNKAIFECATGTGKTFFAIEIMKRVWQIEPNVKVLIVVPKNIILEDTWFRELYANGIGLQDIGVYYGSIKEYGKKVTVTNMQSLGRVELDIFDMVIFDEVHNYGTEKLLPYVRREVKYKVGLSATLERMDDMHYEIMKIFDYNVFKYTPQEALRDGVLNPFNFFNIAVEMDKDTYENYSILTQEINTILKSGGGFKRIMSKNSPLKMRMLSKMNERTQLVNNYPRKFDIVKMVCNKHRDDKTIIFNQFNKQTTKSYYYLLDIGVRACIVHSNIPKEKRAQNIMDFKKGKYNVLLASRVIDEGFNMPAVDTAIIAAGNSTARQTIQRMGRVLRRKTKPSNLYQVYVKDTIEETYAFERAQLFKQLCTEFKEYSFKIDDEVCL